VSEIKDIIGDYNLFLDDILSRVEDKGFDLTDFTQIDHLCYRTVSELNYQQKQQDLAPVAKLLGETMINGRPISTYRFMNPIFRGKWRIDALELPSPKADSTHKEGLEHIEFVLFDDIPTFIKKYENIAFEMRSAERGINPEVGLKLGEYTVKFHLLNLPTVVFLENKLGLHDFKD